MMRDSRQPRGRTPATSNEDATTAQVAPGKRARTDRLAPVQRQAAPRPREAHAARPAHGWMDDPAILAAHGFGAVAGAAGATASDQVVQLEQDPVQRAANISAEEEELVSARAGAHLTEESIDDRAGKEPRALAAREAASMAANPAFEAAAMEWEDIFGGIAYNDELAVQVVDEGCSKAVAYMTEVAGTWDRENQKLKAELAKVQITDTDWSGGVGNSIDALMRAFTTGSLGVKIAHLENFCNKVLAQDILSRDERSLDELLEAAGIDREDLDDAIVRVREGNSRYALHDTKGEAKEQWHMRIKRNPDQPANDISTRTAGELESGGVELDQDEKSFMKIENPNDTLKWGEGARIWALNERDKWVFAMRQLSLPLAAGVSGTTARMMQSFQMLGVGDPAGQRLACIGYLLPTHHHSLVEILVGAAGNGGPAVVPGPAMYRRIEPYEEGDLRGMIGWFPDERAAAEDSEEELA